MDRSFAWALAVVIASTAIGCSRVPEHVSESNGTPSPPPASASPAPEAVQATQAPASTPPPAPATLVLPGDLAPDTTIDMLRSRFGADNVKEGEVPGAEGETFRGVILFEGDSTRRAYLYFQDEQKLRGLSLVRVFEPDTRWRLDNGIAMGMTLAELVRLNGKPIKFTGLDWDYGGTVMDLHGGALTAPDDAPIGRHWRLGSVEGAGDNYPMGDATFSSDDPKYPQQGRLIVVSELSVSFPGEDDL